MQCKRYTIDIRAWDAALRKEVRDLAEILIGDL